jgi:hypothetical protein
MKKRILIASAVLVSLIMILGGVAVLGIRSDIDLAVGDIAPDFFLKDQDGNPVRLNEVLGQRRGVLLAFYPKDSSPG